MLKCAIFSSPKTLKGYYNIFDEKKDQNNHQKEIIMYDKDLMKFAISELPDEND
jgi:hypothetical protein